MAISENPARSASVVAPVRASDLPESPEWQLVQRIVASPAFARSALLTNFLLYVCDRKFQGREDEITEHQIGVQALGRPGNYHPGEDNIVRNYARMLRKRLEEFFENEGKHEALRISIPRGQYVPIFEPVEKPLDPPLESNQVTHLEKPEPLEMAVPVPLANRPLFNRRRLLISATTIAGVAGLGSWFGFHRMGLSPSVRLHQRFWSQIFSPNRECFVVTGDSGFVLLQRLTGRDVSLNEYVNGTLTSAFRDLHLTSSSGKGSVDAGALHFTSTADLNIAVALDRLAMSTHATPKIRNARDMRMIEVKNSNGVFIGGPRANPWIELFEPRSNFKMKFYPEGSTDHANQSIWNKRPKPGEQQEYLNSPSTSPSSTYTMVSFLPSIDEEGWVLLLQGQNLSGTGAAGDFVTNVNSLAPVLERAKKSDGSIGSFEVILETRAVGTDSPKARVIVERYELMKS
jgi:hypothetical protein